MKTMTHKEKDALAQRVLDNWLEFECERHRGRTYPREKFYAFFKSAWAYAEATRRHRLIHRKVVRIMNGLLKSSKPKESASPATSYMMRIDSNACSFADTTLTLRVTSLRGCDEKQPREPFS